MASVARSLSDKMARLLCLLLRLYCSVLMLFLGVSSACGQSAGVFSLRRFVPTNTLQHCYETQVAAGRNLGPMGANISICSDGQKFPLEAELFLSSLCTRSAGSFSVGRVGENGRNLATFGASSSLRYRHTELSCSTRNAPTRP